MTRFLTHLLLCILLSSSSVSAQPTAGRFGVGIQFGQPSGLSLRIYQPGGMSPDFLMAWDLDDFFFVNLHGTWEKPLAGASNFNFFYGPGVFVGVRDRGPDRRLFDRDDDVELGVSGTFGFNYYIDRFEIYLRLTPRLLLIERTDADIGGGVGFRFYL